MATPLPPVAVCTRCGDITYDAVRINQRCGRKPGGKRCKGLYRSALNKTDWAKCDLCKGSGRDAGATCEACHGTGWSYVRNSN
jgi:DnaJ-class molecular chaperone